MTRFGPWLVIGGHSIDQQMANLIELVKFATNQETIDRLGSIMEGLEKQRRKAQGILYDMKEDDEERPELEEEYCHFKLCSLSFKEGYRCA